MPTDTKGKILDSAEILFAEQGYASTSLRDITRTANVNLAAVNYHFGSKEELLTEVVKRRLEPVNDLRLERLQQLQARSGGAPLDLKEILRALLEPVFQKRQEWGDGGLKFIQLLGRLHSESNKNFRARFLRLFDAVFQNFMPAFQRSLPHLDQTDLRWRVFFTIGAMAHTMVWSELVEMPSEQRIKDPKVVLDSLVQFATAGMMAKSTFNKPKARG